MEKVVRMEKTEHNRTLTGIIVFMLLLFVQIILGKAGQLIAGMIPYRRIDPYDSFAGISIHHAVLMLTALAIIFVLSKLLKVDFFLQPGDTKRGIKYLALYTGAFVVISIVVHVIMLVNDQLPVYDFPLDTRNVLGTLGFQLLLSGPAEEIVYRALTITLLTYAFGRSTIIKGNLTLEVVLSSLMFAFAHVNWSLDPFVFEADLFGVLYTFVLGCIQGIAYQQSRSILYPILMHSFSNVLMVGAGYLFV